MLGRVGLVSVALVVGLSAAPAWSATPTALVRPAAHLANGQIVRVTWNGVSPRHAKDGLEILECTGAWSAVGVAACDSSALRTVHLFSVSRRGSAGFRLFIGKVGSEPGGSCGTSASDNVCNLVVTTVDKNGDWIAGQQAAAQISFGPG